jgi:predicted phosphohydrolase
MHLEEDVEKTMNILGDTWQGVHNLKRELKKLRDSVLSFADELINKEVVISSGVIGRYMKEKFK